MDNEKESLVTDNINIAYKLSFSYFKKFGGTYDLEDLRSVSFMGLVKAANTFKKELNFTFSTYAYACIKTEIYGYLRANRKYTNDVYLSDKVEGTEDLYIEDMLSSDFDLEKDILDKMQSRELSQEIDKLPSRYKEIILYRLQGMTMTDIGKTMGFSQPQISRDYNRAINILRMRLIDRRW